VAYVWVLESQEDNLDIRETDEGIEIRHHWTVVRWRHERPLGVGTAVGQASATVSYSVGDISIIKGLVGLGVTPKYICVQDSTHPAEEPTDWLQRTQQWEMYTTWEPAPASWEWG